MFGVSSKLEVALSGSSGLLIITVKPEVMEFLFENYLQYVSGAVSTIIQTSNTEGFNLDY